MEKTLNDMSSEERITYLVNGLSHYLLCASLEARKALGTTPETAKNVRLLAVIEGAGFGGHDTVGAWDWFDQLRDTLADEGMYQSEDEDEEESEEDESDELEEVEA